MSYKKMYEVLDAYIVSSANAAKHFDASDYYEDHSKADVAREHQKVFKEIKEIIAMYEGLC